MAWLAHRELDKITETNREPDQHEAAFPTREAAVAYLRRHVADYHEEKEREFLRLQKRIANAEARLMDAAVLVRAAERRVDKGRSPRWVPRRRVYGEEKPQ